MPSWPSTLPQTPLLRSYGETPPNLVLRTSMDAGPAKVRRRFTAGVRQFSFDFQLTGAQLEILDSFFMDDLAAGSTAFDFPSPRTGDPVQMRFTEAPQYSARGGDIWIVKLSLEALP